MFIYLFNICFLSTTNQKKVYIHYKTGYSLECYYLYKVDFYTELFHPDYIIDVGHESNNLENYDYIVTDEVPKDDTVLKNLSKYPHEKLLLFNFEPPIDQVRSQNILYHALYSKIFTWNDQFINSDKNKYYKLSFPWMNPPKPTEERAFNEKKLCVLVAGNNASPVAYENYSKRKDLIDFFERKKGNDFDFYGVGWSYAYKNWRGAIPANGNLRNAKVQIIKNYKFDICYENYKNVYGYISERIFDAFLAGSVPVYMGALNITDYVPSDCFIDRNKFNNNEDLYNFLKNMSEEAYNQYRYHIKQFLENNGGYQLSSNYQIKQIKKVLHIS